MADSHTKHETHDHSRMDHEEHKMQETETHVDHTKHEAASEVKHDMHTTHAGHDNHTAHEMGKVDEHAGHVDHTGHEDLFRKRFWVSLRLSIPVLLYTDMLQMWLGFRMPEFVGSQWIAPLFSVIV